MFRCCWIEGGYLVFSSNFYTYLTSFSCCCFAYIYIHLFISFFQDPIVKHLSKVGWKKNKLLFLYVYLLLKSPETENFITCWWDLFYIVSGQ